MSTINKILFHVFVFCSAITYADCQECSAERQRSCKLVVLEELDRRSTGLSSPELELHCKSIRQNLNCLVWQLTQCSVVEQRQRTSDVIYKGWKYLQSICDAFGGWWQARCFQREEDSKHCEKHYDGGSSSSALKSSCIEYERFRDCIYDVVKRKCEPEDSNLVGTFLLDKAGEMVWRCSGQTQAAGSLYSASSSYTSALIADSPYVPVSNDGCNARAREEIRGCLDRFQFERGQSVGFRQGDERFKRDCCASWNYRLCVENAIRTHCYDSYDRREVEYPITGSAVEHGRDLVCREHWRYTCSGGGSTSVASLMIVVMMLLCARFANKYHIFE